MPLAVQKGRWIRGKSRATVGGCPQRGVNARAPGMRRIRDVEVTTRRRVRGATPPMRDARRGHAPGVIRRLFWRLEANRP
jgi:hypothetical protein